MAERARPQRGTKKREAKRVARKTDEAYVLDLRTT
jgi:hypothetical protein